MAYQFEVDGAHSHRHFDRVAELLDGYDALVVVGEEVALQSAHGRVGLFVVGPHRGPARHHCATVENEKKAVSSADSSHLWIDSVDSTPAF